MSKRVLIPSVAVTHVSKSRFEQTPIKHAKTPKSGLTDQMCSSTGTLCPASTEPAQPGMV